MKRIKTISELSFVLALPMFVERPKPGRINSLYDRLIKIAEKRLSVMGNISESEKKLAFEKINEFGKLTGWIDKKKRLHALTITSWLLAILEGKYPEIENCLADIADYFERSGKQRPLSYVSAQLAFEKWESLF